MSYGLTQKDVEEVRDYCGGVCKLSIGTTTVTAIDGCVQIPTMKSVPSTVAFALWIEAERDTSRQMSL